ncbi:uncharacterized protein E0L32_005359 [Thyridium curvatum]|uniref:Retinoblastoma-binding protein n=1 Tax=Thyridium curvatum TaxID=1093900 RepID=A0A507AUA6_9PEZI|nr:uncharacterized protein E0L32_005359 [Thyridium curvatum]TPX14395.1 hypothetical protein E0L32_005359 [Thyridium curvatum]
MTSSVYFKFKSQKEPTRVEFDGTGISVFELKRDIITKSGLGDGTDFDLAIYTDDGKEGQFAQTTPGRGDALLTPPVEYDDDTTIIPRSTTVIARRLPPMKPGAGRAARYVSGKMPVNAKNSSRREAATKATAKTTSNAIAQMNNAMTEEEKLAAMFAAQSEQWSAQQEEMAQYVPYPGTNKIRKTNLLLPSQTPVFKPGAKRPANVPDHEPPNGYICYRCGEKGHWIQLCPTNDNPEFDNRPRVKRTTGIPKSFLKTVDKATVLAQAAEDDTKAPSGIMVNADGDFVIAEPDKAAWEKFQAKTKTSADAQESAALADKELRDRGLECPIDKKLFIDPMKTPCCEKTYCNDCITNALIESDFVCPGCQTDGVLIDDLKADDDVVKKIEEYQKEKEEARKAEQEKPKSPVADKASPVAETDTKSNGQQEKRESAKSSKSPTPPPASAAASAKSPSAEPSAKPAANNATGTPAATDGDSQSSKKRPAEEPAENPKVPKAPKAMQQQQQEAQQQQMMQHMMNSMMPGMNGMGGMPGMPGMPMMPFGGMPMMNNFPPMGMPNMNMNMGMMNPMMNPMMGMPNFGNNGMNGGGGFGPGNNNGMGGGWGMSGGGPPMNGGPMNGGYNQQFNNNNGGGGNKMMGGNFGQQGGGGGADEEAYFRKPVNPHRHQNRQKRVRPSDYREL